jgi:hypothetical protein
MAGYVPLSHLSALNPPPGHRLMAVLKAYLDDSGDETDTAQHKAIALAGYIAPVSGWEVFEPRWKRILDREGVSELHMTDFANFRGEFASWRGDEPRRQAFLGDLCQVIGEAGLHGVGAVVRLDDLARFNAETGAALEPMPLAIYWCMNAIYMYDPDHLVELRIDRMKRCHSKVETATEYARSFYADDVSQTINVTCDSALGAKQVLPLQAADFAAYEALKFERMPRVVGQDGAPKRRRSFASLLDAAPLNGPVIDYAFLQTLHDLRLGVWRGEPPPHPRLRPGGRALG